MNRRLMFLSLIAIVLAVWLVFGRGRSGDAAVVEAAAPRQVAGAVRGAPQVPAFAQPRREPLPGEPGGAAFGTRTWVAPPPPPPPAAAAPPPAPPQPPPLPYKFVGLIEPKAGEKPSVFLSLGDKLLVASVGEPLEGGFRIESITATEIVFFNPQWNNTTKLSIEGEKS
jgi:hypothetical protein